jgi:hypothetical protein
MTSLTHALLVLRDALRAPRPPTIILESPHDGILQAIASERPNCLDQLNPFKFLVEEVAMKSKLESFANSIPQ